jgi:PKD repeat protein
MPALSTGLAWSNSLSVDGSIEVISNTSLLTPPPVAGVTNLTPAEGLAPWSVTFSNLSSGATNYLWSFGDGGMLNTGGGTNVTYIYSLAGTYTNVLTAYGAGGTNSATNLAYIVVTNLAPVAGFAGTPTNGFAPLQVVFVNGSTGVFTNSAWSFGNGNVATNGNGGNVTNTYLTAGTYNVSLTVAGSGGSNTDTQAGYVVALPRTVLQKPVLAGGQFIFSGTNGPAGVQYRILGATNAAQALATWTPLYTNTFNGDGSYSYTNSAPTNRASFFILVSP